MIANIKLVFRNFLKLQVIMENKVQHLIEPDIAQQYGAKVAKGISLQEKIRLGIEHQIEAKKEELAKNKEYLKYNLNKIKQVLEHKIKDEIYKNIEEKEARSPSKYIGRSPSRRKDRGRA